MSEKGIFFKNRKNKHGSHGKCSRGSEFPRNNMDYYEGTNLGMGKHLICRGRRAWIKGGWRNNGYIKSNIFIPLINKYVGKPYKELTKAFYSKIKRLREQHKDVGLKDLEWYFSNLGNISYYFNRHKAYYVDENNIVRCTSEIRRNNFTNAQLRHNRDQKIPQYGKVCKEYRTKGYINYYSQTYPLENYDPVFIGNFYCDINNKILLLPVYHVPKLKEYDIKIYQKWVNPRFLQPKTPENKKYLEETSKWVKPIIAIRRNEINHFFEHSYTGKVHNVKKDNLLKTIKDWESLKEVATTKKDRKYLKLQLKAIISKYRSTPDFLEMEAGYGQLYPMVKKEDYIKALNNLACSE